MAAGAVKMAAGCTSVTMVAGRVVAPTAAKGTGAASAEGNSDAAMAAGSLTSVVLMVDGSAAASSGCIFTSGRGS